MPIGESPVGVMTRVASANDSPSTFRTTTAAIPVEEPVQHLAFVASAAEVIRARRHDLSLPDGVRHSEPFSSQRRFTACATFRGAPSGNGMTEFTLISQSM